MEIANSKNYFNILNRFEFGLILNYVIADFLNQHS